MSLSTHNLSAPFNDDLMQRIRDRFYYVDQCPYSGKRIFFENAGGSLTLKSVVEKSEVISRIPDNEHRNNPASHAMSEIVDKGKKDLFDFFGVSNNHSNSMVFGGETGTECLFRLIRVAALALPEGGSIICSAIEHPSTYDGTRIWADRTNREWIEVSFNTQTGIVNADDYAALVRPDTRIATIIHTNPVTGMVMDVEAISRAIRKISPDCYIIVDGIQHAPHGSPNVGSYDVDAYVISMYKVFSKFNNGYAWISERMSQLPHDKLLGKPNEAWELGSRDPSALASVSEVITYLEWLGRHFTTSSDRSSKLKAAGQAMSDQEQLLVHCLLYGVKEGERFTKGLLDYKNVKIIGDLINSPHESVVSFAIDDYSSKEVVEALENKGIRTHARSSDAYSGNILRPLNLEAVTRISVGHYNTLDEALYFLEQFEVLFDS
ncbi:cysteine desulfurase-like protein [Cocleimonas flava]|uniref:Selenocysteine lyase/cysteine desulfurase n=1 Tax=Cocleimonas flava TaxID=634765 RepID=A0A4R1EXP5_9GAMM|nr:aminotransferase class V-fold PLP-dependent enzyme [Cocleimonas flava]TCJ84812.1 selenocysteine lyase/cysteine desulfurase [Cocleimonas flava]